MNILERRCLEPGVIAKSNIILDVKPWDDETGKCSWSLLVLRGGAAYKQYHEKGWL